MAPFAGTAPVDSSYPSVQGNGYPPATGCTRDPRTFPDPAEPQLDLSNSGQDVALASGSDRCPRDGLSTLEQQRLRTAAGPVHRMEVVPALNDFRHHPVFVLWEPQELHGRFRPARDRTPASA